MRSIYEFSRDDAYRFARDRFIDVKERGNELQFKLCPYCHGGNGGKDRGTFSIDLNTGKFKCLRASCNAHGNMITLSRDFDFSLGSQIDEYYQPRKKYRTFKRPVEPVEPKEPAIAYLESRGIGSEIAKKYEITIKEGTNNILVFPFYDYKENLCFIKYRKTDFDKEKDKNKEWCEKDCKPILFGMKQCVDFGRVVITEGQLDSLSVAEARIKNAISVPTGANGFTWIPYCWDWLTQFEEIVVFGDHEKGKITLLEEISKRFPNRIKHVREEDYLECKDANEILMKYGKEAVVKAVENAVSLPINRVLQLADVEDMNIFEIDKLQTGIKELDETLYGGIPFGIVCLLAGKRGDGKSTLASQIMANAIEQGYNTFAYSGELPNYLYKSWFDFQIAGRNHIVENEKDGKINRFITNKNRQLISAWYRGKAFIYDNRIIEDDEQENLLDIIRQTIMQHDVKVILIDNLMTAMYIDEEKDTNKYDQQGRFVRALTRIALEFDCLILLVAHQRKNAFSADANDEVSGSGDITNLAGMVMSYNRGSQKEQDNGSVYEWQRKLVISKNRLFGKINLKGIVLDYDEKSKRIYGSHDDVNKEFSWNNTDGFMEVDEDQPIPF